MTASVIVDYALPESAWLDEAIEALAVGNGGRWIGSGRDVCSDNGRRDIEFEFLNLPNAKQFVDECQVLVVS